MVGHIYRWAVGWVQEWHNCRSCLASLHECDSSVSKNWPSWTKPVLLLAWSRRAIQWTSEAYLFTKRKINFFSYVAQQPNSGVGRLIFEVSVSHATQHTHTHNSKHTHTHAHTTQHTHTHAHTTQHIHKHTHTHTYTHTHTHTPGRTFLNERSVGHRGRWLHNTQQNQGTNINALSKTRTHDSSNQRTAELHLDLWLPGSTMIGVFCVYLRLRMLLMNWSVCGTRV